MSLTERAAYLIARIVVAATCDVIAYAVNFAAWDLWDLRRVHRMTKKKDTA